VLRRRGSPHPARASSACWHNTLKDAPEFIIEFTSAALAGTNAQRGLSQHAGSARVGAAVVSHFIQPSPQ